MTVTPASSAQRFVKNAAKSASTARTAFVKTAIPVPNVTVTPSAKPATTPAHCAKPIRNARNATPAPIACCCAPTAAKSAWNVRRTAGAPAVTPAQTVTAALPAPTAATPVLNVKRLNNAKTVTAAPTALRSARGAATCVLTVRKVGAETATPAATATAIQSARPAETPAKAAATRINAGAAITARHARISA